MICDGEAGHTGVLARRCSACEIVQRRVGYCVEEVAMDFAGGTHEDGMCGIISWNSEIGDRGGAGVDYEELVSRDGD